MNIDDILNLSEFKELDCYLTKEMDDKAGEYLVEKMVEFFGNKEIARDWFYSYNQGLGYLRPYDACKDGNGSKVEDILLRIEHGVYS
jgi:uncharacterized protein (DUF2384 family)